MSVLDSPAIVDSARQRTGNIAAVPDYCHHHHPPPPHHHRPSKRKWDDDDDVDFSNLVHVRMRKVESNAVHSSSDAQLIEGTSSQLDSRVSDARSSTFACTTRSERSRPPSQLQFFVRMISKGNTMVIQARPDDTVKSIHERIQSHTGIPVYEQRLIYRGKQLQWEQSLAECSVQNDASLQLVGRMRSTEHPQAWQIVDDMVSTVCRLCRGELSPTASKTITERMSLFFDLVSQAEHDSAAGQLQIFLSLSAPAALVMLYLSPIEGNKECADSSIKYFANYVRNSVTKPLHNHCASIILEFCKLLRRTRPDDHLYLSCRSALGSLLDSAGISRGQKYSESFYGLIGVKEILLFVSELANRLSSDLSSNTQSSPSTGPVAADVRDFKAFLLPLRTEISEQLCRQGPIALPVQLGVHPFYGEEIEFLYSIYLDLLKRMDECLEKMGKCLDGKGSGESENFPAGWSQYLAILKELHGISELYQDAEAEFWVMMKCRKSAICTLILRYATRADDYRWILQHKDALGFESRRHLVTMMFPEVKEDYEELHEMLIDRSQLLAESFEYIARAEPEALHGGLFMEFKNEEATGPGVLREWFLLVCQAIFNPQNALFVPCPSDRRRFFPNPASRVDPLHLEYFRFSGRVIALALMHKVQVGVVFDRAFFLQLSGMRISLEDIQDADPDLYSSCKKILEMDAGFIDTDALGLTFAREVEELGSRKVVELCPDGKNVVVNSTNREEYVKLLIQHRFVTSISEQVSNFARGFGDIISSVKQERLFFQSLELEDLDWMLYGSDGAISVDDWKAHTEYHGYKETDPQILWFWKIVGEMSSEQRKVLLFFWTSIKYLPVEGFRGLASQLYIYKSPDLGDHLPTSHTCFYRLCFPRYPSMAVMKDRLQIITQEHVSCSFGNW